jgi:hypothetical protein
MGRSVEHAIALAATDPAIGNLELVGFDLKHGSAGGAAGNQAHCCEL